LAAFTPPEPVKWLHGTQEYFYIYFLKKIMEQVDLLLVSTAFVQLEAMAKTNQGNSLIASEYY